MFNDAVHVRYIYKAGKPGVKNYERAMDLMGTDDVNTFFCGRPAVYGCVGRQECGAVQLSC